jgi:hypothetical protein
LTVKELNYWHKNDQNPINITVSYIMNIADPWHAMKFILYIITQRISY